MCLLHICVDCLPDAPLCLHLGDAPMDTANFVQVVHQRKPKFLLKQVRSYCVWVPMQTRSGGSGRVVPCVGARAHVVMPKMLSCEHWCVFYMFVWPDCLTLPCAFIWVMHPQKPQISFGSCTHGNTKKNSSRSRHLVCGCPSKCIQVGWVGSPRAGRVMLCHMWLPRHTWPCQNC